MRQFEYFKTIIYTTAFILTLTNTKAQSVTTEPIVPLRVGDKVPEDFWTRTHLIYRDGDTVKMSLEEHRGKLLILDFWATWCGACKAWFPNNVRLQHEFGIELKILLVNSDVREPYEKIEAVLQNTNYYEGETGSSAIYDTYLKSLFPHLPIPYYVWIDHQGRVKAMTNFEFVTSAQVKTLVEKKRRLSR